MINIKKYIYSKRLCYLSIICFLFTFPFNTYSSPLKKIKNIEIEGLKLGDNLDTIKNIFDQDNRWEDIKLPKSKNGRLSQYSISATLNKDDGTSCYLNASFQRRIRVSKPPITTISYRCSYKKSLSFNTIISKVEKEIGNPDYVEFRGRKPVAYVYVGTNNLSAFSGWEDLSKLCAKEIRASGEAGTDSKALKMAKKAVPSWLPFKDIETIEKDPNHGINVLCPGVSEIYLTHLKEIYAPTYTFEFEGDKKGGIRSTRRYLVNPLQRQSAGQSGRSFFLTYSEYKEKLKEDEKLLIAKKNEEEKRVADKEKNRKEKEEAKVRAKEKKEADKKDEKEKALKHVQKELGELPDKRYGPNILGIQLGMPISEAQALLDKRFANGWRYDLKSDNASQDSNFFNFYKNVTIYINSDVQETVALYYEPTVWDRVTGFSRNVWGGLGDLPNDLNSQIIDKYGKPKSQTTRGEYTSYRWDARDKSMISRCSISSRKSHKFPLSAKVFGENEPDKRPVTPYHGTITVHIGQQWRQEPTKHHFKNEKYVAQRLECGLSLEYVRKMSKNQESMLIWVSDTTLQLKLLKLKQKNINSDIPSSSTKKIDL